MTPSVNRLPTKRRVWRIVGRGLSPEALILEDRVPLLKSGLNEILAKVQTIPLYPVCVYHSTTSPTLSLKVRTCAHPRVEYRS